MTQKHIITSLALLILLALAGGQVLQSQAAPLPEADAPTKIDPAVWQAIVASATREVTMVVSLRPEGGGGPELAIDAQFRLEQMLDLVGENGGIREYQAYYGANIIKITGGLGMLRLLEDWPELESASLYQPGEAWELQMASTVRSAQVNGTGLMIGTITASDGVTPLVGIRVTAYRHITGTTWEVAGTAFTNASGDYVVSGLGTGIYRAKFDDPAGNYATQYYENKTLFYLATNFNVTDGQVTPNINAAMALAGKISGTVTRVGGGALGDIAASAWTEVGGTWQFVSNAISGSNGVYTIGSLPPGDYR
ncbi:MAG: MSCRAMM family protein, partial [Brevefilum sp.]